MIEELHKDFLIQVIDPGLLTLEQQAYYFENTDVVIAEHGGSLANIIFMKKASHVIEIQLSLSISLYGEMARAHSVDYSCIVIAPKHREYSLDLKKLFDEIERFSTSGN
jgi:capsular polysaccharide biosynthesis protein